MTENTQLAAQLAERKAAIEALFTPLVALVAITDQPVDHPSERAVRNAVSALASTFVSAIATVGQQRETIERGITDPVEVELHAFSEGLVMLAEEGGRFAAAVAERAPEPGEFASYFTETIETAEA